MHHAPLALVVALLVISLPAEPSLAGPQDIPSAPAAPLPQTDPARRIADLEQELAAAKRRIAELEAELARVAAPPGAPGAPAPPSADELPPEAALLSPAHFVRFLRESYVREIGPTLPEDLRGGLPTAALRNLERWVAAKNREWRKPVKWPARIVEIVRSGTTGTVTVAILDPNTGDQIGDPILVRLDDRQLRRIDQAMLRQPPPDRWVLSGVFAPSAAVASNRLQPGLFDSPPFIGPGVEFRYQVQADSLAPTANERPAVPTR